MVVSTASDVLERGDVCCNFTRPVDQNRSKSSDQNPAVILHGFMKSTKSFLPRSKTEIKKSEILEAVSVALQSLVPRPSSLGTGTDQTVFSHIRQSC